MATKFGGGGCGEGWVKALLAWQVVEEIFSGFPKLTVKDLVFSTKLFIMLGSHAVNGVAAIHSDLIKKTLFKVRYSQTE